MNDYDKLAQSYKQNYKKKEQPSEEEKEFLKSCDVTWLTAEQLLKLFRGLQGKIESVRMPNKEEGRILAQIEQGQPIYYNLFLCRLSDENLVQELGDAINDLFGELMFFRSAFYRHPSGEKFKLIFKERRPAVSIRDISTRNEKDKRKIIDNFILAERKGKYLSDKKFPAYLDVFKSGSQDFICLLSISQRTGSNKILNRLFHTEQYERFGIGMQTTEKWWKDAL